MHIHIRPGIFNFTVTSIVLVPATVLLLTPWVPGYFIGKVSAENLVGFVCATRMRGFELKVRLCVCARAREQVCHDLCDYSK